MWILYSFDPVILRYLTIEKLSDILNHHTVTRVKSGSNVCSSNNREGRLRRSKLVSQLQLLIGKHILK